MQQLLVLSYYSSNRTDRMVFLTSNCLSWKQWRYIHRRGGRPSVIICCVSSIYVHIQNAVAQTHKIWKILTCPFVYSYPAKGENTGETGNALGMKNEGVRCMWWEKITLADPIDFFVHFFRPKRHMSTFSLTHLYTMTLWQLPQDKCPIGPD